MHMTPLIRKSVVLVTGGAGYIGSHTTLELLKAGIDVVVLDNLSNSSEESLKRVSELAGRPPMFVKGDINNRELLERLFSDYSVQAVLHFAGLKAVGESVKQPLQYYQNNVVGTLTLCQAMASAGVFTLVFSSSATVYGDPAQVPIEEGMPTGGVTNPYGRSKLMVEQMLSDLAAADDRWRVALLRYFNPVGAHESGLIGEDPSGIPNNLLPFVAQVAVGRLPVLSVYGNDYPTLDGTGVRDYIHVMDLAEGHLAALNGLKQRQGIHVWNLGTGRGVSVLQMVKAFEEACGRPLPYRVVPRRAGDVAECWANPQKAEKDLGWKATRDLRAMVADAWRWQSNNPNGFKN